MCSARQPGAHACALPLAGTHLFWTSHGHTRSKIDIPISMAMGVSTKTTRLILALVPRTTSEMHLSHDAASPWATSDSSSPPSSGSPDLVQSLRPEALDCLSIAKHNTIGEIHT